MAEHNSTIKYRYNSNGFTAYIHAQDEGAAVRLAADLRRTNRTLYGGRAILETNSGIVIKRWRK